MTAGPLLQLTSVSKDFAAAEGGQPLAVLRDISLTIAAGETVSIVGPSGSGKSTLLNIMGTLDRPTKGDVLLADQNLSQLDDEQLAAVRNQQIGFVFQAHHLLPQCTVLENVLVPTLVNKAERARGTEHAETLLRRVGLSERLGHRPGQLSGGERQRVAVVRALINRPRLLLADEPTGALDSAAAQGLSELLVDLNREQGVTVVVVTHSADLAQRMCRRLELRDGQFLTGQ